MKQCFKCKEKKPLSEFYKHKGMRDGHLNKCKFCAKKDSRLNRNANIEYYREYDRSRSHDEKRIRNRRPTFNGRIGFYCVIPEGHPAKPNVDSTQSWRDRNPKKVKAQGAANYAIKVGVIHKTPCEVCGNLKVEAHHDDYNKPLEVRFLCKKHHTDAHKI